MLHCGRKLSWVLLREALEEDHSQVRRLGLRCSWIVLDELLDFLSMSLAPVLHVFVVRRIGIDPCLRYRVVRICPLRNDMRLSTKAILLEPSFDIRRD